MYVRQLFLEEKRLPRIDLTTILSHVLAVPKEHLFMEPERRLTKEQQTLAEELITERQRGKPLAYITNRREFFSEEFYVDERVLIPRPETELLVEEALGLVRGRETPVHALDMGTGSGIIGIMLARGGAAHVVCVDVSPGAIAIARRNGRMLRVEDRLAFVVSDLFSALRGEGLSFDVVCANLPYISPEDYDRLMDDVKLFEPKEALVAAEDGMEVYRRFVGDLCGFLRPGGSVLCEIDGPRQSEALCGLLRERGFGVVVRNDLAGRERVVKGSWTSSS